MELRISESCDSTPTHTHTKLSQLSQNGGSSDTFVTLLFPIEINKWLCCDECDRDLCTHIRGSRMINDNERTSHYVQ